MNKFARTGLQAGIGVVLLTVEVLFLSRASMAQNSAQAVATPPCLGAPHVFVPTNHEQSTRCVQPGNNGFVGGGGMGIPIQFERPAGMTVREFNQLERRGNFKLLCARAFIAPADNLGLPQGMTATQFDQANRSGALELSPCATPHMRPPGSS